MKLLIVEDDENLRPLLVGTAEEMAREFNVQCSSFSILEADNLHDALALVPEVDAILSGGCFPAHPNSRFMFDDVWMGLFAAALQAGKRFVLFTGSGKVMEQAAPLGIPVYMKGTAENLGKALAEVLGIQKAECRTQNNEPEGDATGEP